MTTSMQITHDMYKWLVQLQILPNTMKYKSSGNFEIDYKAQEEIQSGYLINKLLQAIASEKNISLNGPLLSSIKNSNTPAARVYNWNILSESFNKLGVVLTKQRQKQITSGNFQSLILFLLDVQNKTSQKKLQKNLEIPNTQQAVDLKKVHRYQEIDQSQSVLQLMIILISKTMGLSPKQAVATLTQSAKYLSHMIVKGIKGSFDEIKQFIELCIKKIEKIMYLVEKDPEKNLEFLLQIFKPMLISRQSDVAKLGCSLFSVTIYECFKYNSKNILYQILVKENEGFDFLYMGLKRHPYLNKQIAQSFYPLLKGTLKDFFDVQLKRTINNDVEILKTMILIVEPLLQNQEGKKQIFSLNIFQQWEKNIDGNPLKLKSKDNSTQISEQAKLFNLQLIYLLWVKFYKDLQQVRAQELLIKLTEQLKKKTRSESFSVRIPSILKIFSLLEFLAANKNKLAALLYKKIIFLFVQNHQDQEMRQILLQNLTLTIRKFPTIPLEFLLQPMLKQLNNKQGTSYILNMYDFQFIIEVCKHPKMEEYYAVQFLDYFIRLYTKSVIYSPLIFRILEIITARFCQSQQIREYCIKSTEVNLNHYGMLVMGKSKSNKGNHQQGRGLNREESIINNQKKSLIIELIKHFVSLQHKEMTQQIKQRVSDLFLEWYENRNHYDKGLAAILMQIGDIQEILLEQKKKKLQYFNESSKQEMDRDLNSQVTHKAESSRTKKTESKDLLKYHNELYADQRGTPNIEEIGLGYKKKKIDPINRFEILASKSRNIKPDPKVLEDLEKIKQKWRLDQSRAKLEQQQAKKDRIGKINEKQLLQRNLSLGYAKLPDLNKDQILFEFDSVRKSHLKDTLDLINLELEETREEESFINVIQRYQKYIKSLFNNYASKSGPLSEDKQLNILSFTEIMRMLKDKGLLSKIPKIAINEVITSINQKRKKQRNVLGGVYEQDFPTFILYYTDLLMQQQANKKDEPFGMKAEKVILKMLEGEKNVKELFDPKIQKLKEQVNENQNIQIPQDFKKVKEVQVQLNYSLKMQDSGIDFAFINCYQIVDEIVHRAVGAHVISPLVDFPEKFNLVKVFKALQAKAQSQSMDRNIDRVGTEEVDDSSALIKKDIMSDSHNSFTKPLKKLSKNRIKRKSESQRKMGVESLTQGQKEQRDKKREAHAKKLKQQIEKLREQKTKKMEQQNEKAKADEEKQKKKQELKKQYLEENKKKIKERKQEQEKKLKQNEKIEQQNKEKKKAQLKAKEAEFLEKQKKLIEAKREKLAEKLKQKEIKEKENDKVLKNKSTERLLTQVKTSVADQKMKELLIKNSIENGEIKEIINKNKKNLEDLFQLYWNWEKEKMELKNLAQLLKDLETSKYIPLKDIPDVYKSVAKGQYLSFQGFIQCLVRLSYKSEAIQQEVRKVSPGEGSSENSNKIQPAHFQFLLKLLKVGQANYKQTVSRIKIQKEKK